MIYNLHITESGKRKYKNYPEKASKKERLQHTARAQEELSQITNERNIIV